MTEPGGPGPGVAAGGMTCYRHADRVTYISCTRCGRPICPDCMRPAAVGFQCPHCVKEGNANVRQPSRPFGGRVGNDAPIVTYVLIGINVLVFLATLGGGNLLSTVSNQRIFDLALVPGYAGQVAANHGYAPGGVADGEYYRMITSCFVHFGLLHIGSNMLVLYFIGPSVERLLGRWRYATVYLLAGLGGSVATYLFVAPVSESGGASGAIFGLFAALFVIGRHLNLDLRGLVGTIVLNLVITFSVPGISITAHLGGLVTGGIAGLALTRLPRRTPVQIGVFAGMLAVIVILTGLRTAALS